MWFGTPQRTFLTDVAERKSKHLGTSISIWQPSVDEYQILIGSLLQKEFEKIL